MKKHLIAAMLLGSVLTIGTSVSAQSKVAKAVDKTGNTIGKGASKVGNKSAELATKGFAKVKDKTYKGKMAPDGSDVYIDKKDKKYYLNQKGKKIYLKLSQIKAKPVKG